MSSEEHRVRIPYKLGTDHFCEYEEDAGEVCMRDMVTVCYETPSGEFEYSGELCFANYDWEGYISSVTLFMSREDSEGFEVPCDGVFYRMEDGNATN